MLDLTHLVQFLPLLLLGMSVVDTGNPIADAGKAFLDTLTPEQRNQPLSGPDDDEGDDDQPAGAGAPAAGSSAAKPALTPPAAAGATPDDAPITRQTDGATWNGDAQRWTLNGKFVEGAAPEGWVAPVAAAADPAKPEGAKADTGAESTGVKVTLKGLSERGEEDIEIEVDPELAQRIQRLNNDGMRARDYQAKRAEMESREAQIEAYQQALEHDPIGFHLNQLPKEEQLNVARALLIEHLPELLPDIEDLRDPEKRFTAHRDLTASLKQSGDRLTQNRQVAQAVRAVVRAAEALVPEGTDAETAASFIADARYELAKLSEGGTRITPESVPALLKRRMSLYGFDKPPAPASPAAAARPVVPVAAPAPGRARDIASAAPARPAPADAAAVEREQARIRRTQNARAAGSRVAPPGAGAAPVQAPAVPPEAEADIASMSRHLRRSNMAPERWPTARE